MLKENLNEALEKVGGDIVTELKSLIEKDKFRASGDLDKSISYKVEGTKVEIYAAEYAEGLSSGISKGNGSKSEFQKKVSNIREWAKHRGVVPRDKSGRFIKRTERNLRNMAFNIAVAIGRKGISKRFGYSGSGFFDVLEEKVIKNVTDIIFEAYKKDIIVEIKNSI